MDLTVSFLSMLLLMFGLSMVGLGVFTTYFGAGKSRIIGVLLLLIGITILAIFYIMATDYTGYDWEMEDVSDSFLGVVGIGLGAGAAFGLVIGLMMIIKEQEPEIPGLDDWEKEMASDGSKDPLSKDEDAATPAPGPAHEDTPPAPGAEPEMTEELPASADRPIHGDGMENAAPKDDADDDMNDFLKDKEEKRLDREDWEKVDQEDATGEDPSEDIPEHGPEDDLPDEPPAEHDGPVDDDDRDENGSRNLHRDLDDGSMKKEGD